MTLGDEGWSQVRREEARGKFKLLRDILDSTNSRELTFSPKAVFIQEKELPKLKSALFGGSGKVDPTSENRGLVQA